MEPLAQTKHGRLTLTQVAEALPGTGEAMRAVGHCFAMAWHAAEGGNWDLAAYFVRRSRSTLRSLATTRPRYADQIQAYDRGPMESVYGAILARDRAAFGTEYARAVEGANRYHVETGHPYIRWHVPAAPPESGLDLSEP